MSSATALTNRVGLLTLGILGIDGRRQLAVTTYCVQSFFDAYLKSPGVSRLRISSLLCPELQVLEYAVEEFILVGKPKMLSYGRGGAGQEGREA